MTAAGALNGTARTVTWSATGSEQRRQLGSRVGAAKM